MYAPLSCGSVCVTGGSLTNVPHWMDQLAEWDGNTYAAGGGYGFLREFADREEPRNDWGFDGVDQVYDSNLVSFSDVSIDAVTITPGNFIRW